VNNILDKLEQLQVYSCHGWDIRRGDMKPDTDGEGEWLSRADVLGIATLYGDKVPPGFTLVANRHFDALAEGMAEILATHRGESGQPIGDIIEYVLNEIENSAKPSQGF